MIHLSVSFYLLVHCSDLIYLIIHVSALFFFTNHQSFHILEFTLCVCVWLNRFLFAILIMLLLKKCKSLVLFFLEPAYSEILSLNLALKTRNLLFVLFDTLCWILDSYCILLLSFPIWKLDLMTNELLIQNLQISDLLGSVLQYKLQRINLRILLSDFYFMFIISHRTEPQASSRLCKLTLHLKIPLLQSLILLLVVLQVKISLLQLKAETRLRLLQHV